MERKRSERRKTDKVISVNHDNCARCRSCVRKCRHQVLEMVSDEQGLHVEVAHPAQCTACGECLDVCRFNALQLVNKNDIFDDSETQNAEKEIEHRKIGFKKENKMKIFKHFIWRIPFYFLMVAVVIAVVMLLWNWLVPTLFGISAISFWQAAGLFILARILFGGWGRSFANKPPFNHHSRMHDKWMTMTDREREEFINRRRNHFFHGHFSGRQGFGRAGELNGCNEERGENK